jgi:hypothetical protein
VHRFLFEEWNAIPKEELVSCTLPIEVATAEATQLAVVAVEDREPLIGAGIEPVFVDSLPARAGAFTYAAAKYQLAMDADPEAAKKWKEEAPKGYELQRYLIRNLAFAYRKDPSLTEAVDNIREGRGHKDMILDLLALSILGAEHPEPLAKLPMFDKTKVAEAMTMHDTLSGLFARINADPEAIKASKNVYLRAYTYYKQAADEVMEHGRFVFEGTDRYSAYVSNYLHNLRKTQAAAAKAKAAEKKTPQAQ